MRNLHRRLPATCEIVIEWLHHVAEQRPLRVPADVAAMVLVAGANTIVR
jgi:hypothetical protein